MKKWKDFTGWQKGSIIGFSVLGLAHLIVISFELFVNGIKGVRFGLLLFELPLYIASLYIKKFLNFEIFFELKGFLSLVWFYVCGTIAWGVVGAIPGLILGLISDFFKKIGRKK